MGGRVRQCIQKKKTILLNSYDDDDVMDRKSAKNKGEIAFLLGMILRLPSVDNLELRSTRRSSNVCNDTRTRTHQHTPVGTTWIENRHFHSDSIVEYNSVIFLETCFFLLIPQ